MNETPLNSFAEFWPFYVREHGQPWTRRLHFLGTNLALVLMIVAAVLRSWWLLLAVPLCGYGLAWFSHFVIERNRPATFRYPLWSLRGDMRMWWLTLTGRMPRETERILGK
jgi:hypothetical protein